MQPPRSPGHRPPHGHQSQKLVDELADRVDALEKSSLNPSRLSRGDSTEQVVGLTPITEDARSKAERQEDQGRSSHTLKELRKQMEDLLVYQQMQQTQPVSAISNDTPRKRRLSTYFSNFSTGAPAPIMHSSAGSAGSTETIKGIQTETTSDRKPAHTPSYPFPHIPHIQNKPAKMGIEPTPRGGPFRLKLPSEKSQSSTPGSQSLPSEPKSLELHPIFLPAHQNQVQEDPNFLSPNLYDLTLQLNADSGLEAWWSNLIHILQKHYGAERVSLAVPGDVTDLENVPWGQKAIFNQNVDTSLDELQDRHIEKETSTEKSQSRKSVTQQNAETVSQQAKMPGSSRPSLLSRHSFAGFDKNKGHTPHDPSQQLSKINGKSEKKHVQIASQNSLCADHLMGEHPETKDDTLNTLLGSMRQAVFPIARPLEVELDPLIKRTGVARLFGRTRPTILTREYTESAQHPRRWTESADSPNEMVQVTPNLDGPSDRGIGIIPMQRGLGVSGWKQYDEYEQVPQSPWSQSPAPSPAPRTHADQNPFFTNHSVDEGAFSKHPPSHDYSNNLPLEAIGVDQSKTVIHIPLLHGGHSNQDSSSTLRFPVAVVSMLCTIVPYPPNLRQSLSLLMPHLTTSFCLAQRYSQLERQLSSKMETPRFGPLLGLGGTFSDASSELELVAGLSGHVNYSVGDNNHPMSAHTSITSPSDRTSLKCSPAVSAMGTPGFELGHIGFGSANLSPGVRSGGEGADSYFNVPQNKSARDNASQNRPRLVKSKTTKIDSSMPLSPDKVAWKPITSDEHNLQDQPFYVTSPLQETRPPNALSPTQNSSRHASTNSLYAQLQRELPRPFSDTIAQLMLNSIPLHLFLAKPQSGEVIWTNSKFDAYRRSQHQEQRFRDPWQNIHSSESEHVHVKWANALRTGAQFTERVRVRRFNDESAYRWFIFRANPLLSATGEVLYWIGSFLDIHEQHIAELEAIQEREKFAIDAKYRAFSNSIPQVVFEATENRGLIFVNEQWNLYTGQPLEEAYDLGFAKHVHPDDLEKCGELALKSTSQNTDQNDSGPCEFMVGSALDELVKRGIASLQQDENGRVFYSTEIRLRSRGGDYRWHLVRVVRVKTSSFGSEKASWYGTCTDINDRKNLERELNKAMQQLNHQMESKTKFFSNMSHEIRTPLNGILGTIPFILDTQLDSDQRRMLDTIQNSSTNLRELVDNILDVSRVEAGKMSIVKSWFHIRSMIEDVIDTIASRAIDKGLEINYLIGEDLPSMVIGDRFRIRQVLINLLGNAVKFTAQGEIHICCDMYREPSANLNDTQAFMNFEVVDTGKGFSSQDAERLMQRFSQLGENGTQQNAGSGLGLFLSKQLVEMHGGKLTPSSKEGQGAKFSFNVKVDAPPPPSPSEQPKLLHRNSTASRRPAKSRTTSYQQAPSLAPRNSDSSGNSSDTLLSAALSIPSSALLTPDLGIAPLPPPLDQTQASENLPAAFSNTRIQPAIPEPDTPVNVTSPTSQASVSPDTPTEPVPVPVHGPFSIVILCPLKNSRQAIKQHIEQVVPHEIPFKVTTLVDVDEWKDAMHSATDTNPCTHLVLNLSTDDILEVIQNISDSGLDPAPVIVIIADFYQKRQISSRVKELAASGKQIFIVPKPVKPSAFSSIFDPKSKRELSKDRNQDMAREINNNFKTVSKMVKEVLGNKGYRILLVEDDETNRDVMLKYLDKIKLMSETASNGLECTNMVLSKEPGYYSLIICDIQMPIKNGYDTCREIREWEQMNHYPQIPIMALSANAMTDQIENAARAGFNDYVTKPIRHNELGKMMMGLLEPGRPLMLLRDRLSPEQQQAIATRR
ncbi:Sensor histidine kinase/response regulator, putative [Penicillium digitatum]|uniref:histidine kinase n=3 Tax=Penicillium digitatum TaxID=36651 RepID=K9F9W2_PEND2|nr:Sensor histidine kinase/response regulator, putative [Penicillium digitatum Pd1]EKV05909.1 Sensor histidine kinase/response regulator, putative [Penicillium digitatum PHI26]EKV17837.1 Sensor histidine kinase/response regulator, putative [Penicillium digitatum Pd1]QQK46957.1 Sensor histidine kinase/response regulator, putative [Penicillium digitatum]